MTTALTLSPADVLRQAADWLAEDPARWGRDYFINPATHCRCALGAVAQVINPFDLTGDPTKFSDPAKSALGKETAAFLANYLIDFHDAIPVLDFEVSGTVEEVAHWNDQGGRTATDVIAALRSAADEFDARQAARAERAS